MKKSKSNRKDSDFRSVLHSTHYALKRVWSEKTGKNYIFISGALSLLNAVVPLVYTVLPGLIINELINLRRITYLAMLVGILALTPIISHLINFFADRYQYQLSLSLNLTFRTAFYHHSMSMDYESLENPDVQILKERADGMLDNLLGVINQLYGFISSIIALLAISSIIITLGPLIIIFIVCNVYINFLTAKKCNDKQFEAAKALGKYDRLQGAYSYMLDAFEYAKEIRLFDIKSFLINLWTDSKYQSNKLEIKHFTSRNVAGLFSSIINAAQQVILYAFSIYKVFYQDLAVGSMTIYMSAATQFSSLLNGVFNSYLGLANSSLNIQELIKFMNIPLKQLNCGTLSPIFDKNSIIEFVDVSFKYPGSDFYALKHLNLTIRGDEKLCIVGSNGSGKTTFIKLLTRLYFPTEGKILLNGVNINNYDYAQYQRLFAPVFQDCATYYISLGQNIALTKAYDKKRLDEICAKGYLDSLVAKLKEKYDTQVGKWIDEEGFDPSGGEQQRIAIARAIYHGGNIFLLDEPTAALDPMTEYEIYTQFNSMITDKCAVLITHRLSAVQLADKIAVFSDGNVIEYGTHEELHNKGGLYTEMFDKQAEFYRTERPN